EFEDLVLKEDEKTGELKLEPIIQKARVFDKIYMDLHEDEMQFSNERFRALYHIIIESLNRTENFQLRDFVNQIDQDMANEVTTILMDDERYALHDWERNHIIPKNKDE